MCGLQQIGVFGRRFLASSHHRFVIPKTEFRVRTQNDVIHSVDTSGHPCSSLLMVLLVTERDGRYDDGHHRIAVRYTHYLILSVVPVIV